jgi:hypothetical protein
VQPPEALGVGVRLVAGVDDGPLERGLQPDDLLEELGPLGDLEVTVSASRAGVSTPTLPDPVKMVRETKCGTTPSITLAKGTARSIM